MAISEIYVEPALASDTGTGIISDPFGDLEYAIEQTTHDTANGTRVNIKAGTDEILAADLATALADTSVSVAWVGSELGPIIFSGYTAAAGDGGIGGISGGGAVGILVSTTLDYVHVVDMHCHNTGTNPVIQLDDYCSIVRCEGNNTTGMGFVVDDNSVVSGCYVHNVCGDSNRYGIYSGVASLTSFNYVEPVAVDTSIGIFSSGDVFRNIVIMPTGSTIKNAITLSGNNTSCDNNTLYANASAGTGIGIGNGTIVKSLTNNVVEGFSGLGGIGIDVGATATLNKYGGNACYNNETEYNQLATRVGVNLGDNETLTASPFTSASTGDFSPVDTGNVKEGSLPQLIGGGHV